MLSRRAYLETAGATAGVVGLGSCLAAIGAAEDAYVRLQGVDVRFDGADGDEVWAPLLRALSDGESSITYTVAEEIESIVAVIDDIAVPDRLAERLSVFDDVRYRVTYCYLEEGDQRCETRHEPRARFNRVQFGDPFEWDLEGRTFSYEERYARRGGPMGW